MQPTDAEALREIEVAFRQGRREEAQGAASRAAAAQPGTALAHLAAWLTAYYSDEYASALEHGRNAVAAAQAAQDKRAEAKAADSVAHALRMLDRYEESLAAAQDARRLAAEAADKSGEANAADTVAQALRMLDRYEESLAAAQDARRLAQEARDKLGDIIGTPYLSPRLLPFGAPPGIPGPPTRYVLKWFPQQHSQCKVPRSNLGPSPVAPHAMRVLVPSVATKSVPPGAA